MTGLPLTVVSALKLAVLPPGPPSETVNAGVKPFWPVVTIPPVPDRQPVRVEHRHSSGVRAGGEERVGDRRRRLFDGLSRERVVELPAEVGYATWRGRSAGVERHIGPTTGGDRLRGGRQGAGERQTLHAAVGVIAPLLLVPLEVSVDPLVAVVARVIR